MPEWMGTVYTIALGLVAAGMCAELAVILWSLYERGVPPDRIIVPLVGIGALGLFLAYMCWDVWRDS